MPTKCIEAVLLRAMSDTAFADALFEDADKALAGYDLTAKEIAKFKGLFSMDHSNTSAAAAERRKLLSNSLPDNQASTNHNEAALKVYK
jgi:hypothetical protein